MVASKLELGQLCELKQEGFIYINLGILRQLLIRSELLQGDLRSNKNNKNDITIKLSKNEELLTSPSNWGFYTYLTVRMIIPYFLENPDFAGQIFTAENKSGVESVLCERFAGETSKAPGQKAATPSDDPYSSDPILLLGNMLRTRRIAREKGKEDAGFTFTGVEGFSKEIQVIINSAIDPEKKPLFYRGTTFYGECYDKSGLINALLWFTTLTTSTSSEDSTKR